MSMQSCTLAHDGARQGQHTYASMQRACSIDHQLSMTLLLPGSCRESGPHPETMPIICMSQPDRKGRRHRVSFEPTCSMEDAFLLQNPFSSSRRDTAAEMSAGLSRRTCTIPAVRQSGKTCSSQESIQLFADTATLLNCHCEVNQACKQRREAMHLTES